MASVAISQMYSVVHPPAGDAEGHSAVQTSLPSIHAVLHRTSMVRKTSVKSSIPIAARGGATSKVIKQPIIGYQKPRPDAPADTGRCMTPSAAIAKFRRIMSDYELSEIKNYRKVWFVGPTAQKIRGTRTDPNFGYDNENGRYNVIKNDHLAYRYEVLKFLGKGSFGDVMQVFDHKEEEVVALKIIRNEPRFHEQAKEEIKILELLRERDEFDRHNLIHIKDYFKFRGHLCITFEICAHDLYTEIKMGKFAGFPIERVKAIGREIVQSLRHLRRNKIIHCDLKPENILLRKPGSSGIKVIDFGSSCFVREQVHTYIQSRFYRAPEIILGILPYGCPIDMWSLGCILVELYTGRPLFPGASEREQLMFQVEYLGMPPSSVLAKAQRARKFVEDGMLRKTTDRRGRLRTVHPRSMKLLLGGPSSDPEFVDFIKQCLTWDPEARMTPRDASRHPFLAVPTPTHGSSTHTTPLTPPYAASPSARRQSEPPAPVGQSLLLGTAEVRRGLPVAAAVSSVSHTVAHKSTRSASGGEASCSHAHNTRNPNASGDGQREREKVTRKQSQIFVTATGISTTCVAEDSSEE